MRSIYQIAADIIFVLHFAVVIIVLFGWAMPGLWNIYMGLLCITLLSDLIFGYCVLSKWEFNLRKRLDPKIHYDFPWASYYTYKFTDGRVSNRFVVHIASVFLLSSIAINAYFKYRY